METTHKYKVYCLLALLLAIFYACSKGKMDEEFTRLSRLKFTSETGLLAEKIIVDGRITLLKSGSYIFPFDEKQDSIDIELLFVTGTKRKVRIPNLEINDLHVNISNPVDSTIIISKENPFKFDQTPPEGKQFIKIANMDKRLSPDGSPIHLVFFSYKLPYQIFVDPYEPPQMRTPIDTLFNVTSDEGEFRLIPRPPLDGDYYYIVAKVLKSNKEELLIDGNRVYLAFYPARIGYSCFITERRFRNVDPNHPLSEGSPDGGKFLSVQPFIVFD